MPELPEKSLQQTFAPHLSCFGCGPANPKGLRIESFPRGDRVICDFQPQPHHVAYEGMVNGGILGALLDCHMNWTAAWHLMNELGLDKPPCTVTAEFRVVFLHPTRLDQLLHLEAWVTESHSRKALTEATISVGDEISVRGYGTFVSVKPGHPAFHRW